MPGQTTNLIPLKDIEQGKAWYEGVKCEETCIDKLTFLHFVITSMDKYSRGK